jgi:hypothetical protein
MEGGGGSVILVPSLDISLEELRKPTKAHKIAGVWVES